jgi:hypothetical protein
MSFAIAFLSLAIAALAAARRAAPSLDAQVESWGVASGIAVIVFATLSYAVAMRRAGARP